MWILLILAINVNNPNDIPGRVQITFKTQEECREAADNMSSWLKFKDFRVTAQCIRKLY